MVEKCPKCASHHNIKAGLNNGKRQRYKCKGCGCHFTRSDKKGYPPEIKRKAIQLYLEGLGLRAIGRILNVSNVTILNWTKGLRNPLGELIRAEPYTIEIIKVEELYNNSNSKCKLANSSMIIALPPIKSSSLQLALVIPNNKPVLIKP